MIPASQVPRVGVLFRPQLPPERLREFVASAEASGLDDVWMWEDCFLEGGLTSAAAALAWSSSVRIGLGLMPVPLRNPALAAMEIATLARLFPGRFVPAVGHGVLTWMDQVGARAPAPMTLLREWVTATRSLLKGDCHRQWAVRAPQPCRAGLAAHCRHASPDRCSRAQDTRPGRRTGRWPGPRRRHLAQWRPPGGRDGRSMQASSSRCLPTVRSRPGRRRANRSGTRPVSAAASGHSRSRVARGSSGRHPVVRTRRCDNRCPSARGRRPGRGSDDQACRQREDRAARRLASPSPARLGAGRGIERRRRTCRGSR
jgi:alkanesulfonate monooxygenase SsuD/methylene tetrahydromethanopterin reductase-like flavin-dependent oxidoreductase (luciferase family)